LDKILEEESCEIDNSEFDDKTKRSNLLFLNSQHFAGSQNKIYSVNTFQTSPLG